VARGDAPAGGLELGPDPRLGDREREGDLDAHRFARRGACGHRMFLSVAIATRRSLRSACGKRLERVRATVRSPPDGERRSGSRSGRSVSAGHRGGLLAGRDRVGQVVDRREALGARLGQVQAREAAQEAVGDEDVDA